MTTTSLGLIKVEDKYRLDCHQGNLDCGQMFIVLREKYFFQSQNTPTKEISARQINQHKKPKNNQVQITRKHDRTSTSYCTKLWLFQFLQPINELCPVGCRLYCRWSADTPCFPALGNEEAEAVRMATKIGKLQLRPSASVWPLTQQMTIFVWPLFPVHHNAPAGTTQANTHILHTLKLFVIWLCS